MEFKLDKENWKKVKFGDVAIQLKGTVNRADTDLKYYVKGEHMNTDDIHIREFGELTDEYLGPAFIRYFKPGDILYGSRRTYLKKVAVAHIEGITSNTTFVIDARENFLNKSLIPFLMLSDGFTRHSIMHSKGSVNPYVNWKDLANYEFLLPPKPQQAELAELLMATDEVIEKDVVVLKKLEEFQRNFLVKHIVDCEGNIQTIGSILSLIDQKFGLITLSDLGLFLKGKGIPKDDVQAAGIPCIRYGEIYTSHHFVIRAFKSFISEAIKTTSFLLKKGDIIFAGSGEKISEIGKSVCFEDDFEAYAGGDTIILRPNSMVNPLYLTYVLNSDIVRLQLNKIGTGATVAHIYTEDLKRIKIPKISLELQKHLAEKLEDLYQNIFLLKTKIASSQSLQKSLINKLF